MPPSLVRPSTALLLLVLISVGTLLTAFTLEYVVGLEPCNLCIWQRWPFAILMVLGLAGAFWKPRLVLGLAVPLLLVGAGLGAYHVGIEQGWIALPASCTAGGEATSVEELKALLAEAPPTCDQVSFKLFGLSLAAWNIALSLILAAFALFIATRPDQAELGEARTI